MGREVSIEEIYQWTKDFQCDFSNKRVEENVKFVFKLTLKHLRTIHSKNTGLSINTPEAELSFYNYYFSALAKQWNMPITDFFDPLNYKTQQRTLNSEYIHRLFKSTEFSANFLKYLESGQLKLEYQASIPKKLIKLLHRFDKLWAYHGSEKSDELIFSVQKYFRTNKQCKLPWTEREVDSAIQNLIQMCKE